MTHSDIKRDSAIIGIFPERLRPYALLMRLDRPAGTWLLLLPGLWALALAGGAGAWPLMLLFAAGAVAMRGAGCVVNDMWDRDLDRRVARTAGRPLASGALGMRQAFALLGVLLLAGLSILLQLNPAAIMVGCASLPFVALYPLMKRITWWPQAFLGLTFNFGALVGWAAATGGLALPAWLLYAAGFFWTLGYDTVYAHQDIDDDEAAGIKSSARRLGRHGRAAVASFYAVSTALLVAAFAAASAPPWIAALPMLHMAWQVRAWKPFDAASSLRIFRSNRDFGLLVFAAALFAGALWSVQV